VRVRRGPAQTLRELPPREESSGGSESLFNAVNGDPELPGELLYVLPFHVPAVDLLALSTRSGPL